MRIAFVVQRYGEEVNGGAEALCRWVAERMRKYFRVEVLTTCALDYLSWENHFPAGISQINAVTVRRFPTDAPRDMKRFNKFAKKMFADSQRSLVDELAWIRLQGPASSQLLAYIKTHEDAYDLFVFVTYSYLTTFLGLQLVPGKSVLIPAAHDEPHFFLDAYRPIFHLPRGILYNTEEERRFVQRHWRNAHIPSRVAGAGLPETSDAPTPDEVAPPSHNDFGADAAFPRPYLLYVGRVDVMKGCRELFTYFQRYRAERQAEIDLVCIGKQAMPIPDDPHIHAPGFVEDAEKDLALRHAALVVNPSEYESLSFMVLEAWQTGVAVLVNGASDVLVEHCLASNGGLYYTNYEEFALALDALLANRELRTSMGGQGKHYVAERYSWTTIEKIYADFFLQIAST